MEEGEKEEGIHVWYQVRRLYDVVMFVFMTNDGFLGR